MLHVSFVNMSLSPSITPLHHAYICIITYDIRCNTERLVALWLGYSAHNLKVGSSIPCGILCSWARHFIWCRSGPLHWQKWIVPVITKGSVMLHSVSCWISLRTAWRAPISVVDCFHVSLLRAGCSFDQINRNLDRLKRRSARLFVSMKLYPPSNLADDRIESS